MKSETFTCDICGTPRTAANHWLLVLPWAARGIASEIRGVFPKPMFLLFAWDDVAATDPNARHICGASCATKALDAALHQKNSGGDDGQH